MVSGASGSSKPPPSTTIEYCGPVDATGVASATAGGDGGAAQTAGAAVDDAAPGLARAAEETCRSPWSGSRASAPTAAIANTDPPQTSAATTVGTATPRGRGALESAG